MRPVIDLPGEGTVDQVRADLDALRELGAEMVVLDPHPGGSGPGDHHALGWSLLERFAGEVVDLGSGQLR